MARAPGTHKEDNGAFREVVDEFTFPGNQQEQLQESQAWVQTLFPVVLTVLGSLQKSFCYDLKEESRVPERIWLQLKGNLEAVRKAKEFIKGLSDPEMVTTEKYPKEMHCIFVGARRCFLQSLIRDTCAIIKVLEIGVLAISGTTEPVVMAQSKVQQFVKVFRDNVSLIHSKEPEVKRKYKDFVEAHADKYTVDLLFLPSMLKEELLNLIANDRYLVAEDDIDHEVSAANSHANDQQPGSQDEVRTRTPVTELACQMDSVFFAAPQSNPSCSFGQPERLNIKRRGSEKENECRKKPFSLEVIQADGTNSKVPIIDLLSTDSDDSDIIIIDPISEATEYKILVNFFKTMGYPQAVVEKVISDLGQSEEPLKLLDEIEKRSPSQHAEFFKDDLTTKDHKPASKPTQEVNFALPSTSNERILPNECLRMTRGEPMPENVSFVARGTSSPPLHRRIPVLDAPGPSKLPPSRIAREVHVKSSAAPLNNQSNETKHGKPAKAELSVTGVQIFLNSIKTPHKLELKNEPGREDLKHIIIDGSNVAMSHGMKRFFSCRGIAIAVEYFWRIGHRKITVFVPQWRTKRDPYITEQHFLQELEELGILSFTPARTVMGSRIASHDDRFLLHLAEKTRGVIVTNDNLREFVTESPAWQQIIKERILQYTFAGDIFMIPDDPLGRHGPQLNDFLTARPEHRNKSPPADDGILPTPAFPLTRPLLKLDVPPPNLFPPRPINPAIVNMPRPRALPPRQINPAIMDMPRPRALPPRQINPAIMDMPRPRVLLPTQRNHYETSLLKNELSKIFPETEQREKIGQVLSAHPYMRDLNALSAMILD